MTCKVLIVVEDPGAANYVLELPQHLQKSGVPTALFASAELTSYLTDRHVDCQIIDDNAHPSDLLADVSPDLVIVGTSENLDAKTLEITDQCRADRIPTLGVVDMSLNAERRFKGHSTSPLQHAPDWLAVPDCATQTAYIRLGFPEKNILVCGHPHYDRVRDKRTKLQHENRDLMRKKVFPDLDLDRPILLFVAEGIDKLNPEISFRDETFTLHGRGDTDFRTAIVLEELIDAAKTLPSQPQIVLRLHPKTTRADFSDYLEEVDAVSEGGDPLELMWAADGITGMSSMLLLEAYLLQLPTLSILARKNEEEWLVTLSNGLTPIAHTREELKHMLNVLVSGDIPRVQEQNTLISGGLNNLTKAIEKINAQHNTTH